MSRKKNEAQDEVGESSGDELAPVDSGLDYSAVEYVAEEKSTGKPVQIYGVLELGGPFDSIVYNGQFGIEERRVWGNILRA